MNLLRIAEHGKIGVVLRDWALRQDAASQNAPLLNAFRHQLLGLFVALETPTLEVVYYSSPIPSGPAALTLMGLIFDKIHFPNVYLPTSGFDPEAVRKEADRIASLGTPDYNTAVLIDTLRLLPLVKELKDFCFFTGQEGQVFGNIEESSNELVKVLDEEIFGPPKPGFHPMYETGFHKGLPDKEIGRAHV